MSQRRQPEQEPPPVQKLRVRYAKRGRARFASHRDFARAFERALRRAEIPMALSSGFNKHPRISFANAVATGAATEADYLEIGLARVCDPEWVGREVSAALPDGMEIIRVVEAEGPSLMQRMTASQWLIQFEAVDAAVVAEAVARFLASDSVEVVRSGKKGERAFDARASVKRLDVVDGGSLRAVIAHATPQLRPDDVLVALSLVDGRFPPVVPLVTREAQGTWDGEQVKDPLAG